MDKQRQYERVFKHFDEDGDGKISAGELQQCVQSMGGGVRMSLEECKAAVELMDSDGDGLLCMEDFLKLVEGGGDDEKTKDLMGAFKMYEMEGCGYISPKSLKRMLSRLGESRSLGECKTMIARFDLNGDGVLCFDEFKSMMAC